MGWMEGLRGVGVMSLAVFTMWVFSRFAPDDSASLKRSLLSIVWFTFCWAFCVGFVSDNNNLRSANNEEKNSHSSSDIPAVLRISTTRYCSMVILVSSPSTPF